jgi:hypothetical protein
LHFYGVRGRYIMPGVSEALVENFRYVGIERM